MNKSAPVSEACFLSHCRRSSCHLVLPVVLCLCGLLAEPLPAQSLRYELGSRLRRFEQRFESQLDEASRQQVLQPLSTAVQNFFGMQLQDAASQMDTAWVQLWPEGQRPVAQWTASRAINLSNHLLTGQARVLTVVVSEFYANDFKLPAGCKFICTLDPSGPLADPNPEMAALKLGEFPCEVTEFQLDVSSVPQGDYQLRVEVSDGADRFQVSSQSVAKVDGLQNRLQRLDAFREQARKDATLQPGAIATLRERLSTLNQWLDKNDLETDFSANRELSRMESLVQQASSYNWLSQWVASDTTSENLLASWSVTLAGEKRRKANLRLFVPPTLTATPDRKVPLVLALHGAGGSENMFFDGYGDGKIVKLCQQRGWILAAPGIGLSGIGLQLDNVVDQLAEQFPIDRESVFIVGHSMGAAYAIRAIKELEDRDDSLQYRVVVALGGGRAASLDRHKVREFWVAAGSDDFGKPGAKALHASLKKASIPSQYHEYAATEHLGIVQVALTDVFAFLDESLIDR